MEGDPPGLMWPREMQNKTRACHLGVPSVRVRAGKTSGDREAQTLQGAVEGATSRPEQWGLTHRAEDAAHADQRPGALALALAGPSTLQE